MGEMAANRSFPPMFDERLPYEISNNLSSGLGAGARSRTNIT